MADIAMTVALAKVLGGGGGGGGGGVSDVKVNGTSVVTDGVANVPLAGENRLGVIKKGVGVTINPDTGSLHLIVATNFQIKDGHDGASALSPEKQHMSVFFGLAKAAGDTTQKQQSGYDVGTYTETAKSKISEMLSAPETISGSTPSITAKPGVQYICGEVSTIDITVPATGCVDIIFVSGSTPTVLSLPTGQDKISWADGWDETCEANTTYELNILNGKLGVKGQWT